MPASNSISHVHALALIKGSAEGDHIKHFAALSGIPTHVAPLLRAGLLVPNEDGYGYSVTQAGQDFYDTHRLCDLPPGRANNWGSHPIAIAASAALAAITG